MGIETKVHRLRFFKPDTIYSIECMRFDAASDRMAILKRLKDGHSCIIEIWFIRRFCTPLLLQTIHEDEEDSSYLEAIEWGNNGRLFSAGRKSTFHEHDLLKQKVRKSFTVGGGPVRCLASDVSKTRLLLGSDDGSVSTFNLGSSHKEVSFGKIIGKCSAPVLSVVWYGDSVNEDEEKHTRVIAGSMDHIYIWSYRKGVCLDKLLIAKGSFVWSLDVCDRTLIAGDSSGVTSFWDIKTRVKKESFKHHEGDVLTVAAGSDGHFFSSGSDPKIAVFFMSEDKITSKGYLYQHRHDVKALCLGPKQALISAGNGPFLVETKEQNFYQPHRLLSFNLQRYICIDGPLVLLQYLNLLELYNLDQKLPEPEKTAVIKSKRTIKGSFVTGDVISYWTSQKLFFLRREGSTLKKLPHNFNTSISPLSFTDIVFLSDAKTAGLSRGKNLTLLDIKDHEVIVKEEVAFGDRIFRVIPLGNDTFVVILESKEIFCVSTLDKEMQSKAMATLRRLPLDCAADAANKRIYFLMANRGLVFWDLGALRVEQLMTLKKLEYTNLFHGMVMLGKSLLIYSSDIIIVVDIERKVVKFTLDQYKHICKVGVNSESPFTLNVIEIPDPVLQRLLPYKLDCKTSRKFLH